MKKKPCNPIKAFFLTIVLFAGSCSAFTSAEVSKSKIVLIGSTPGDAEIKSLLVIAADKAVDFIRWDLSFDPSGNEYILNINFGEGQPNTSGFKGDGEKRAILGRYSVAKNLERKVYTFSSPQLAGPISLVEISDNVFHFLTSTNRLMVGNGGWSYTLSRKERVSVGAPSLTTLATALLDDRSPEVIFDGRTPCVDLGRADLQLGSECRKLKWKLTLYRNPNTGRPTAYRLQSTMNRPRAIEGKWTLINGMHANPRALILQLDPDKADASISFLVGDDNVIFLLKKDHQLLAGNGDFAFTLNRRQQEKKTE